MKKLITMLALAFAATTAAAKPVVKVTGRACDFIRGYYVEYEINGIKYRSDKTGVKINQIAWENMSDEDRQTTVESVYGVFNARKEQFGSKAQEMGYWYDKKKGWVQGAEILTDGLVKRDYPSLYEKFSSGLYFSEIEPARGGTEEIEELYLEAVRTWEWACEAYKTIRNAVYVKTSVATKSISGDLIELITDKCLVPNITPAGMGGTAASAIGTVLDYVNNLAGIQSGIIDNVIGKRTKAEEALEVIERCNMVIAESISFINTCITRIKKLADEVKAKNEQFAKEYMAEYTRLSDELNALVGASGVNETNAQMVARLVELKEAYDEALKGQYASQDSELRKAYEEARKAYDGYRTNSIAGVKARYDEWHVTYFGNKGVGGILRETKARVEAALQELEKTKPERGELRLDLSDKEWEEQVSLRRDYIAWCESYSKEVTKRAPEVHALAEGAMLALGPVCQDNNALYSFYYDILFTRVQPHEIVEETKGLITAEDLKSIIQSVGEYLRFGAQIDEGNGIASMRKALAVFEGKRARFKSEVAETREIFNAVSNEVAVAKEAVEQAHAEYKEFIDGLPKFVTEQNVNSGHNDYPGLHFTEWHSEESAIPLVVLNPDTELGRTFLDPDNPASVATAVSYRSKLNALRDKYVSLLAKIDYAETVYKCKAAVSKARISGSKRNMDALHKEFDAEDFSVPEARLDLDWTYDKKAEAIVALDNDFNNRNPSHETEMDIFNDLTDTENDATYAGGNEARYPLLSATADGYAKHPEFWSNPKSLYGYWNGDKYDPTAPTDYHRGVGSYAYFAPGYYETVFAGEPDPYNDLVSPILRNIEVALAAANGITLHIVTFDANGGSVDTAYRTVEKNAAVGKLPTPARNGWTFGGWWTAASGGTKVTEATIVSANVTYYAHWTQGGGGSGGSEGGGQGGGGSVTPGYEVLDAKDIVAPYAAPKAVTLQGVAYDGGKVVGIVELKLGKVSKGKGKVSGSFTGLDGKKISIKPATVEGIDGTAPAKVSFEVKGHGTMSVTIGGAKFAGSLGGWHVQSGAVGGNWGKATATVGVDAGDVSMFAGTVLTDLLPNDEQATANGGKWAFRKAAGVKWAKPKKDAEVSEYYDAAAGKDLVVDTSKDKTNLSGLKLTYTPKKGTFKGKFTVYALEGEGKATKLKKYKVGVTGVVVNGTGYGQATMKKPAASWAVTVK